MITNSLTLLLSVLEGYRVPHLSTCSEKVKKRSYFQISQTPVLICLVYVCTGPVLKFDLAQIKDFQFMEAPYVQTRHLSSASQFFQGEHAEKNHFPTASPGPLSPAGNPSKAKRQKLIDNEANGFSLSDKQF